MDTQLLTTAYSAATHYVCQGEASKMLTYVALNRGPPYWLCKALATGLYRLTANVQMITTVAGDIRYIKVLLTSDVSNAELYIATTSLSFYGGPYTFAIASMVGRCKLTPS